MRSMFSSSALSCGSHVFRPSTVSAPRRAGSLPEGAGPGVTQLPPHVSRPRPPPGIQLLGPAQPHACPRPTLLRASGSLPGPFTAPPEPPRAASPPPSSESSSMPCKGSPGPATLPLPVSG